MFKNCCGKEDSSLSSSSGEVVDQTTQTSFLLVQSVDKDTQMSSDHDMSSIISDKIENQPSEHDDFTNRRRESIKNQRGNNDHENIGRPLNISAISSYTNNTEKTPKKSSQTNFNRNNQNINSSQNQQHPIYTSQTSQIESTLKAEIQNYPLMASESANSPTMPKDMQHTATSSSFPTSSTTQCNSGKCTCKNLNSTSSTGSIISTHFPIVLKLNVKESSEYENTNTQHHVYQQPVNGSGVYPKRERLQPPTTESSPQFFNLNSSTISDHFYSCLSESDDTSEESFKLPTNSKGDEKNLIILQMLQKVVDLINETNPIGGETIRITLEESKTFGDKPGKMAPNLLRNDHTTSTQTKETVVIPLNQSASNFKSDIIDLPRKPSEMVFHHIPRNPKSELEIPRQYLPPWAPCYCYFYGLAIGQGQPAPIPFLLDGTHEPVASNFSHGHHMPVVNNNSEIPSICICPRPTDVCPKHGPLPNRFKTASQDVFTRETQLICICPTEEEECPIHCKVIKTNKDSNEYMNEEFHSITVKKKSYELSENFEEEPNWRGDSKRPVEEQTITPKPQTSENDEKLHTLYADKKLVLAGNKETQSICICPAEEEECPIHRKVIKSKKEADEYVDEVFHPISIKKKSYDTSENFKEEPNWGGDSKKPVEEQTTKPKTSKDNEKLHIPYADKKPYDPHKNYVPSLDNDFTDDDKKPILRDYPFKLEDQTTKPKSHSSEKYKDDKSYADKESKDQAGNHISSHDDNFSDHKEKTNFEEKSEKNLKEEQISQQSKTIIQKPTQEFRNIEELPHKVINNATVRVHEDQTPYTIATSATTGRNVYNFLPEIDREPVKNAEYNEQLGREDSKDNDTEDDLYNPEDDCEEFDEECELAKEKYNKQKKRNYKKKVPVNRERNALALATLQDLKEGGSLKEMKFFIDSLIMDLDSMEYARRRSAVEKNLCRPRPGLCSRESFPVTITEVTDLGTTSLYVKWIIHDCYGIKGYEIYTDGYLTNRYYNCKHEAAVITNVDVTLHHKIALVAQISTKDDSIQQICNSHNIKKKCKSLPWKTDVEKERYTRPAATSSLWTPSIYLYDPAMSRANAAPPLMRVSIEF